jgi:hypothetical protein
MREQNFVYFLYFTRLLSVLLLHFAWSQWYTYTTYEQDDLRAG